MNVKITRSNLQGNSVSLSRALLTWVTFTALFASLTVFPTRTKAQTNQVKGTVISAEDNSPLTGVSVSEVGTQNGTLTDAKGNFTLTVGASARLGISLVGYLKQQVAVEGRQGFTVRLQTDNRTLNEVVVIGYGTARRRDLVGSVSTVTAKEAGATTSTSPAQLLAGKAAGVQVVNTSGVPGSNAQIIIRGTGSFTSVEPVYVIDGIQGDANLFNSLSSQDIESITILKDASSTAIYGAAAANGVVIVTTRKGRKGVPHLSITSQWGVASAWKKLDVLKAPDYVNLINDINTTNKQPIPSKLLTPAVLADKTDWQKAVFRNALVTENDVNITGGSDRVTYSLSLVYITQAAIVRNYENNRVNSRFALDETFGRFHFGQSLTVRYTTSTGQLANLTNTIGYAPYQPIYDSTVPGGYSILSNLFDGSDVGNPLQPTGVITNRFSEYVFYPQLFAEVNLIKGLRFRSQIAATYGGNRNTSYQVAYTASNFLTYPRQAALSFGDYFNYRFENYLSFNRTFGLHALSLTLGTSYLDAGYGNNLGAIGTGISNDAVKNISVALTPTVNSASQGYGTLIGREQSYYGRVIYTLADKYVLSGTIRRDGSSNFGGNYQNGNFPGAGFAWKFGEERFIKSGLPFVSDGKVRVGYGRTGNNNFGLGQTNIYTYSGSPNGALIYSLGADKSFQPGTTVNGVANPNLRWEQTNQTDAGLDLGFFNDRLNATFDYYDRKSNGLLVRVPIPTSVGIGGVSGVTSSILTNAASAENKGIEVSFTYKSNRSEGLNYSINLNGGYNKNNTLSLGNQFQAPIQAGSFNQLNAITYTAKGSPIGSFYGSVVDHVARDQAEINALNQKAQAKTGNASAVYQAGLLPGDFIFKDLNGDGTVDSKDQKILGNPIPKFIYGLNVNATLKNWDLNIVLSGIAGVKLVNALKYFTQSATTGHNATTAILNRWEKPGDVAALPRAGQNATGSGNLRPSTFFVEDGSYLRGRNVTLGYTFSGPSLKAFSGDIIKSMRIYVAAQNLFTVTKYKGYDPEISVQTPTADNLAAPDQNHAVDYIFSRGIDSGQTPQPRTLLAGLQLSF